MPITYEIVSPRIPDDIKAGLFIAWVIKFSETELALSQHGSAGSDVGEIYTFGNPVEQHFALRRDKLRFTVNKVEGLDAEAVDAVIRKALDRTNVEDFGDGLVYVVPMTVQTMDLAAGFLHFARSLGDQVHIEGSRRLSDAALLDFEEGLITDTTVPILLAPEAKVKVTIFVPGPTASDLSGRVASSMAETIAAVCALATGRPVDYSSPRFALTDADEIAEAEARRRDPKILGLARDSVSLDVFGGLIEIGGVDGMLRLRGSLLAYHAALRQTSPDVSLMLFVTAIEALFAPRAPWGKNKVTDRFIKSLIELCPDAVDEVAGHANVEEAFGWVRRGGSARQREEILDVIYQSRSLPTHAGLDVSGAGLMAMSSPGSLRVALLSDLSRAAILAFLQAPRSSLIGHPVENES